MQGEWEVRILNRKPWLALTHTCLFCYTITVTTWAFFIDYKGKAIINITVLVSFQNRVQ